MSVTITVTDATVQPEIYLGRQGEKNYREIVFDLSALVTKYGSGTATLYHQRSQDVAPYLIGTTTTSSLTWTVDETDTVYAGIGYAEIRYAFGTDNLYKTTIFATNVKESLAGDVVIPEPLQAWYDAMIEYGDENWGGSGSGSSPSPSSATPQPLGTATAGTSTDYSRADHVHAMPSASDIGAGTYSKPSGGIPLTDLASGVQTSLGLADTAYQKPSGGIPAADMSTRWEAVSARRALRSTTARCTQTWRSPYARATTLP